MRRDDETVWLLLAAGVLVMMSADPVPWGDPAAWTWPVPDMITPGLAPAYYAAAQSQEFRKPSHLGVDIMYRRVASDALAARYAQDHGSAAWFAPPTTPILAARAGKVWSVDKSRRGIEVVLDHGHPFATYYQHLADTTLPMGTKGGVAPDGRVVTVAAGERIGTMGFDPTDPEGLRHLHFAVWFGGDNTSSVDPERAMRSWRRETWRLT